MPGTVLLAALLAAAPPAGPGTAPGPADTLRRLYREQEAARVVPLLLEAIRFPTVEGDLAARDAQQAWLRRVAAELGLGVRDAGPVTELELPGPPGAPVLGLVVHGDVVPVAAAEWSAAPFAGVERDGYVWGRGAVDDKGPMVQALLALSVLRRSGLARTHTLRLLVGSDEESTNLDITTYLRSRPAPDLSLVLDLAFPVVVGEKAWNALTVTAADPFAVREGGRGRPRLVALEAGLATSIVPSRAAAVLRWSEATAEQRTALALRLRRPASDGLALAVDEDGADLKVTATGRSAHAGVNLASGRNALVFLARALAEEAAPSGAADLLAFAAQAGKDLAGSGLGLDDADPQWGSYDVNVATIRPAPGGGLALTINIRRPPPRTGPQLRSFLEGVVAAFAARRGGRLAAGGFFEDEPLAFDRGSKLVRRLQEAYARAAGRDDPPIVTGGGTYAKRLPRSIAFGMFFPGTRYPGHDTDERVAVADLHRGMDVLLEVLADLALNPPLVEPFRP